MKPLITFSFIFHFLLLFQANAETLKPILLYKRCYAHLTGTAPLATDTRMAAVLAGTKTAASACKELVDLITIDSGTGLLTATPATENYMIAKLGLNHMYNAMRQWTHNVELGTNFADYYTWFYGTEDFYDFTSVGISLAEILANNNKHPRSIFEVTSLPTAIKEMDQKYKKTITIDSLYNLPSQVYYPNMYRYNRALLDAIPDANIVKAPRSSYYWYGDASTPNNPDDVPFTFGPPASPILNAADSKTYQAQAGELIGIKDTSVTATAAGVSQFDASFTVNVSANAPLGGKGIFGYQPYVMMNAALSDSNRVRPNLTFMPRRFIQAVIQDFLCRDLPVLRDSDIMSYISTDPAALPFRKARSCAACHATMDQAASTLRGLRFDFGYQRSSTLDMSRPILQVHIESPNPGAIPNDSTNTNSANLWSDKEDVHFYKRPSTGKFYFRSYDGKLTNISLNDFSQFTDQVAQTDDAYICLSKKMFKQMTGIDVKMFDAGDPRYSNYMMSLSPMDWKYRDFVINQGLELKKTNGHLKTLIKAIIDSPYYQKSDYGKSGVSP